MAQKYWLSWNAFQSMKWQRIIPISQQNRMVSEFASHYKLRNNLLIHCTLMFYSFVFPYEIMIENGLKLVNSGI
jgi:hypothetical protein